MFPKTASKTIKISEISSKIDTIPKKSIAKIFNNNQSSSTPSSSTFTQKIESIRTNKVTHVHAQLKSKKSTPQSRNPNQVTRNEFDMLVQKLDDFTKIIDEKNKKIENLSSLLFLKNKKIDSLEEKVTTHER